MVERRPITEREKELMEFYRLNEEGDSLERLTKMEAIDIIASGGFVHVRWEDGGWGYLDTFEQGSSPYLDGMVAR